MKIRRKLFSAGLKLAFAAFVFNLTITVVSAASVAENSPTNPGKPHIYTVNYPLYEMARIISGDLADIYLPELPGDPAFWEPDIETILAFQNADLILLNGANYAKWTEMISLPEEQTVITSHSFEGQLIPIDGPSHSHGPEGEHSHSGIAFTTWLDMKQVSAQAQAIGDALVLLMPNHKDKLEIRLQELQAQLSAFDKRLMKVGAVLGDKALLYSHPVYQYFERAYGLNGVSVQWEPHIFPDDNQWQQLKQVLETHPAKFMLWEEKPSEVISERLKDLNIDVLVFSPISNRPRNGSFLSHMTENIERFERLTK